MYKKAFFDYKPYNHQEVRDKNLIINFINKNDDALYRTNLAAHVTSSAFILNKDLTKVCFVYHNIYNSWSWVGGHNDGNPDLLEVAIAEAKEETGLTNIKPLSKEIFTIDVIYVPNHIKHNQYVPDHLHLNAAFILQGDETEELIIKTDENSGVRWFLLTDVFKVITEDRMIPVYKKAFEKLKFNQEYRSI